MSKFRDATGRPGPSTWGGGSLPHRAGQLPGGRRELVRSRGLCRIRGKAASSIWHWYRAAEPKLSASIIPGSNFAGAGPAPVGSYNGRGLFGTYDMAGNPKEWCWNETENGSRFLLGGAWNDPTNQYYEPDARQPMDRGSANGFRCVRYTSGIPEIVLGPRLRNNARDYSKERPASEEVFGAYRTLFAYDHTDLRAVTISVDNSPAYWKIEVISYTALYGAQRIPAYLFTPKETRPPYQTG